MDHLAPLFLLHRRLTPRYLALFVLAYAALVVAYLLFWHVFPLAALTAFLLCSWLHWGQGDAYFLRVLDGQPVPRTRWGSALIWAVRGGLPIVLPPLAHPAAFAAVAGGILSWYGSRAGWMLTGPERGAGLIVLALAMAAYLWQSWRLSRRVFWRDAGEAALLTAYFLVVPAILAVGIYFCVWHSARHIGRLMHLDPADQRPLALGDVMQCVRRSAAQALPMTLGALAFLAGLYWWQGHTRITVGSFVYLYLSLIAALTFPHFLLVLWMDRKEFGEDRRHPVVIGGRGDAPGDGL